MNFSMDFYLRLSIPYPSGHAFSPLPILKGNPNNIQKETELKLICRRKLLTFLGLWQTGTLDQGTNRTGEFDQKGDGNG